MKEHLKAVHPWHVVLRNWGANSFGVAKDRPERVVASQRIVDRADVGERNRWTFLEPLVSRGRLEPTVLAVPI